MKNYVDQYWKGLEKKFTNPFHLNNVQEIDSQEFLEIKNKDIKISKELISNLYSGDFIIIKKAFSVDYMETLKDKLIEISKKSKSSFYKMLENCPNFHRIQNEETLNKYSVNAIRHSYYFFRWNKDKLNLFKTFDPHWLSTKLLGGLNYEEYVNNTPKDGVIDRIQIVKYPSESGFIEPHQHHPLNQRLIISVYMSQKKVDYKEGGTYFFNKKNQKINLEDNIEIGDMGIFYATLKHGVDKVTVKNTSKNFNSDRMGRWWIGLYSPESDHITNRNTSNPI